MRELRVLPLIRALQEVSAESRTRQMAYHGPGQMVRRAQASRGDGGERRQPKGKDRCCRVSISCSFHVEIRLYPEPFYSNSRPPHKAPPRADLAQLPLAPPPRSGRFGASKDTSLDPMKSKQSQLAPLGASPGGFPLSLGLLAMPSRAFFMH